MNKRKIKADLLIEKISELIKTCSTDLPNDVLSSIKDCLNRTNNEQEKKILNVILENANIAKQEKIALCQDTGMSIFFIEMGKDVEIEGETKDIKEIINKAVQRVYSDKKLRPSIINDPLNGNNTKDNTPAFINIVYNDSNKIKFSFMAKGGGSENASLACVIPPSQGFEGIKDIVVNLVREKGINACPPLIIGIGIGGTLDHALLESKKALLQKIGERNPKEYYAQKELELKNTLNNLEIGAMGLGGSSTVLDVFIKELPRHIASLPVAVSILCHSARRGELTI
jgi:fumarate hydratase subunit alpha